MTDPGREAAEGSIGDRRDLERFLAFVYVAFSLDDEAREAYRSAPAADEGGLDPDLVSPRIRDVLSKCARGGSGTAELDVSAPPPQI